MTGDGGDAGARPSPARWREITRLAGPALELPPDGRAAYLDAACGADAGLRADVERFLRSCEAAHDYLAEPVAHVARPPGAAPDDDSPAAAAAEGTRVGPYRIVREAGRGGMGAVYVAERDDGEFSHRVALKLMRPAPGHGVALARRFRVERQILASLHHEHIARLLDGGVTEDGAPFYVMEFVDGVPLDRHAQERGLSIRERLLLFRQVAAAVRYAHQRLVVHRDLKPSNILVTTAGEVKLLDFGIAKVLAPEPDAPPATLTGTLGAAMTPEYASPEQFHGEPITVASDVYSLGVILFQLLTDQLPFGRLRSPADLHVAVTGRDAPRPSDVADVAARRALRGDLDTIVLTALRKDPARRYGSVEALDGDIGRYLAGLPVGARPDTLRYRTWKFVARNRWGVAAAAAIAGLAVTGGTTTVVQARRIEAEAVRTGAVSGFLLRLLRVPYPYDSGGGIRSLKSLLDSGAARLESELPGETAAQVELMEAMGQGYFGLAEYAQARRLFERALALRRARGDSELQLVGPRSGLGEVLGAAGDLGLAIEHLAEVVRVMELQRRKPAYAARWRSVYVRTRLLRGEVAAAESTLLGILPIFQADGDAAIAEAHVLSALGRIARQRGALALAESRAREALRLRQAVRAADVEVASSLAELAAVATERGRLREADSLLRTGLVLKRRQLGDAHVELAHDLVAVGDLRAAEGRLPEAAATYRTALARHRAQLGPWHYRLVPLLAGLGEVELRRGQVADARASLAEALALLERVEVVPSPQRARVLAGLGRVARAEGRREDAARLLARSERIYVGLVVVGDRRLADVRRELGALGPPP